MDPNVKENLIRKRGRAKAALTRIATFLEGFNETHDSLDIEERLDSIPEIKAQYNAAQEQLEDEDIESDHSTDREEFTNRLYSISAKCKRKLIELQRAVSPVLSEVNSVHSMINSSNVKLPTIQLPSFAGNCVDFPKFRDTFESLIINNATLSDVQKLHYLNSTLKDEAKLLINNLPITNENFSVAWSLLNNRYYNKRIIANSHLNNLLSLPNENKQAMSSSIRDIVNQVRSNINAIEALDLDVPLHELIWQQLILNNLSFATRKSWEATISDNEFSA